MNRPLDTLGDIIQDFGLGSLVPTLRACENLSDEDAFVDVAVLGQFKSGKSSLLNALLGAAIFPVSVLPATAVITRASASESLTVCVRHLNGEARVIAPELITAYVTEDNNPKNERQVAVVDIGTPNMNRWPGLRVVDTPGLGSVHAHNTEATRAWMPNVAVALVTVSAERPLSDEDRRLVIEALQLAPRVVLLLTKVDLLTEEELRRMVEFIQRALREFAEAVPVLPFSTRSDVEHWVRQLDEIVFHPLAKDVAAARRAALIRKLERLTRSCREYLQVGLQSAERSDSDRDRLNKSILDESMHVDVIRDELLLAERRIKELTRPTLEKVLHPCKADLTERLRAEIASEMSTWKGSLSEQTHQFEKRLAELLLLALPPHSEEAAMVANDLLGQAEERFRRIVEAFRARLGKNVREAMGIAISPVHWEAQRPRLAVLPIAVGRTFMINWGILSWLFPMTLFGGLFRRHALHQVPWEVEKNLSRLVSDWSSALATAVTQLRREATGWVEAELTTIQRLLCQQNNEAHAFQKALLQLEMVEQELDHGAFTAS